MMHNISFTIQQNMYNNISFNLLQYEAGVVERRAEMKKYKSLLTKTKHGGFFYSKGTH